MHFSFLTGEKVTKRAKKSLTLAGKFKNEKKDERIKNEMNAECNNELIIGKSNPLVIGRI